MRKAILSLTDLTPSKRMTLTLLAACLLAMVALFGLGLRTAETQTTPSYYKVQALGTLPGATYSPPTSVPLGINDFGHVVGYASFSTAYYDSSYWYPIYHAFLYKDGVMKDLGSLGATAINNSGQVAGSFDYAGDWTSSHAFLYDSTNDDSTNGMQDLSTLGGTNSYGNGINDSGEVVGYSYTAGDQNYHAFLYEDGVMKDLGTLGGSHSNASDINDSGQVVGEAAYDSSGYSHAFLYDSTNGMQDLGTLGGTYSYAAGINDSGEVVGQSVNSSGQYHAFLYKDGVMKDLGSLGGHSNASDINDSGQVVGGSYDSSGQQYHHVLYQNEEMIDFGTRLHPDDNGNVWNLDSSNTGINNEGQIVAAGWRKDTNVSALLLTPTSDIPPPPPADSDPPSTPTITSPAGNSYNTDGVVTISGTAEAGSTVTVVDDASSPTTKTATADSNNGAWSVTFGSSSSKLADAIYTYNATAKDTAGNTSLATTLKVTVDKTAPTVTESSLSPTSGATGVMRNTPVTATFSEAVDPATVTKQGTITLVKASDGTSVPATVTYDTTANNNKVTLKPSSQLAASTKYKVTVKGGANSVTDKAGNPLASDKIWSFTTGKK
jgi:probable HAF family extracellular repeat protein